ncbi:MAG: hypothetical protein WAL34_03810 [Acidobacteriaceae bacterium]
MMAIVAGKAIAPQYEANSCEKENLARVVFLGNITREAEEATRLAGRGLGLKANPDDPAAADEVGSMFAQALHDLTQGGLGYVADLGGGLRMRDVVKSESMEVVFPFTDDSATVVRLNLKDPEFRKYVSHCVAPGSPLAAEADEGPPGSESVDDFIESLPDAIRRNSLEPFAYGREIDALRDQLKICAQLSPELASTVPEGVQDGDLPSKLGLKYRYCFGLDDLTLDVNSHQPSPHLHLGVEIGPDRAGLRSGGGWHVRMYFGTLMDGQHYFNDDHLIRQQHIAPSALAAMPPPDTAGDPRGVIAPSITEYKVYPDNGETNSDHNIQVQYAAYTRYPPGIMTVQMLRAPDVNGQPGAWQVVNEKTLGTLEGPTNVMMRDEMPPPGKYWYGTNVIDRGKRATREPAPFLITVDPPPAGGNPDSFGASSDPTIWPKAFKGSAAAFVAALPGYIDGMAATHGLPPHSFDQEEAYIAKLVTTCAEISPQTAPKILEDPKNDYSRFKDGPYKPCGTDRQSVTQMLRGAGQDNEIWIDLKQVGRSWALARGIDVYVTFRSKSNGDRYIVRAALDMTYQSASSGSAP